MMTRLRGLEVVRLLGGLLLEGCGSAGGATGGTGGAGGDAAADAACASQFPACFTDRLGECFPAASGACTKQDVSNGANYCYANGVKVFLGLDTASQRFVLRYYESSGGVCYTELISSVDGSTNFESTVVDSSGAFIATVTSGPDGITSVTCGGQTYPIDSACGTGMPDNCTTGVCQI